MDGDGRALSHGSLPHRRAHHALVSSPFYTVLGWDFSFSRTAPTRAPASAPRRASRRGASRAHTPASWSCPASAAGSGCATATQVGQRALLLAELALLRPSVQHNAHSPCRHCCSGAAAPVPPPAARVVAVLAAVRHGAVRARVQPERGVRAAEPDAALPAAAVRAARGRAAAGARQDPGRCPLVPTSSAMHPKPTPLTPDRPRPARSGDTTARRRCAPPGPCAYGSAAACPSGATAPSTAARARSGASAAHPGCPPASR